MSDSKTFRKELESSSLEDSLKRIQGLVDSTDSPRPLHLGILLALHIALEMRSGKEPGTETATMVAKWVELYGEESVDEAVTFTRQFLLKPQELVSRIASKLDEDHE